MRRAAILLTLMLSEIVVYFLLLAVMLVLHIGPFARFVLAGSAQPVAAGPLFTASQQFVTLTMYVLCPLIIVLTSVIDVRFARDVSFIRAILLSVPAAAMAGFPSVTRTVALIVVYTALGFAAEYASRRYQLGRAARNQPDAS